MKLPQGGVEVWKGLCCPKKPPRQVLYLCVPWPGSHGEKSRGKRGVGVLGMKRLVGERSWRVSAAGTSWMVHCFANHAVFLIHSYQLFCPDVRRMRPNCFPASGGKMTCGSCKVLAKSLPVWQKAFPTLGLLANEEKMLGRGKAEDTVRKSFANLIEKDCFYGTVSVGEIRLLHDE